MKKLTLLWIVIEQGVSRVGWQGDGLQQGAGGAQLGWAVWADDELVGGGKRGGNNTPDTSAAAVLPNCADRQGVRLKLEPVLLFGPASQPWEWHPFKQQRTHALVGRHSHLPSRGGVKMSH